jgi:hypothetical protein
VTPAPARGSPPSRGLIVLAIAATIGMLGLGIAVVLTHDGQAEDTQTGRIDRGPFRGHQGLIGAEGLRQLEAGR